MCLLLCLQPLGTQLDAKVIRPFVAQGVQSQTLQKPILVIVITGAAMLCTWLGAAGEEHAGRCQTMFVLLLPNRWRAHRGAAYERGKCYQGRQGDMPKY
jgi:hypothetical protein